MGDSLLKFDFKAGRKMRVYQFPLCNTYTSYIEAIEKHGLVEKSEDVPELSFSDPYSALEDSFTFTSALATELTPRELHKLRNCRAIITPSLHSHTILNASRLGVPVVHAPYGVDTSKYSLRKLSPKCCNFGYVAQAQEDAKVVVDAFTRAFAGIQNVRLHIMHTAYATCDIRITATGCQTDSEWYPWLTALIVLPQVRCVSDEALKAMARGVPVITANYGFSAEYCDSLYCYPLKFSFALSDSDCWAFVDAKTLADQMRAVYDDQEQAEAKGLLASQAMQECSWNWALPMLVDILSRLDFWKNKQSPCSKGKHHWLMRSLGHYQRERYMYDTQQELAAYTKNLGCRAKAHDNCIESYGTVATAGYVKEACVALKSLSLYTTKPIFVICDEVAYDYLISKKLRVELLLGITPGAQAQYIKNYFTPIDRFAQSKNNYSAEAHASMLKKMDALYYGISRYGNCLFFDADTVFTGCYDSVHLAPLMLSNHHWNPVKRVKYEQVAGEFNTGHVFSSDISFPDFWANLFLNSGVFIDQDCMDMVSRPVALFGKHVNVGYWRMMDFVPKARTIDLACIDESLGLQPLRAAGPLSALSYHGHMFTQGHKQDIQLFRRYVLWNLDQSKDPKHKEIYRFITELYSG